MGQEFLQEARLEDWRRGWTWVRRTGGFRGRSPGRGEFNGRRNRKRYCRCEVNGSSVCVSSAGENAREKKAQAVSANS